MAGQTHYARSGEIHIAYQVAGEGPPDVLELTDGTYISIDESSEEPHWERYIGRLSSFCRLIRFDIRGVGLSDPLPPASAPTLEQMMEDCSQFLKIGNMPETAEPKAAETRARSRRVAAG